MCVHCTGGLETLLGQVRPNFQKGVIFIRQMKKYTNHLDYLRKTSNIRTEDFIENICSPRQWRRYISGENLIPQDRFKSFCNKLGITPNEFEVSYYNSTNSKRLAVNEIEQLIFKKKYDEARKLTEYYLTQDFEDTTTHDLVKYYKVIIDYLDGKEPDHYILEKLADIINYPECLSHKYHTYIDFLTINRIAEIETKQKKTTALMFIYKILQDRKSLFLSYSSRMYLPYFFQSCSKSLWLLNDVEKSFEITQEGIKYCLKTSDNSTLAYLYYVESYILDTYSRKDEAYESARKCIATCYSRNEIDQVDFYNGLFLEEQGYKIELIRT